MIVGEVLPLTQGIASWRELRAEVGDGMRE
jgi:hypothetical protein